MLKLNMKTTLSAGKRVEIKGCTPSTFRNSITGGDEVS